MSIEKPVGGILRLSGQRDYCVLDWDGGSGHKKKWTDQYIIWSRLADRLMGGKQWRKERNK